MSKTKKWALWGAGIGLVIGILETVGIVYCNWNPVESTVFHHGLFCDYGSFIYLFYIPFQMLGFIGGGIMGVFGNSGFVLGTSIVTLIVWVFAWWVAFLCLGKIFNRSK